MTLAGYCHSKKGGPGATGPGGWESDKQKGATMTRKIRGGFRQVLIIGAALPAAAALSLGTDRGVGVGVDHGARPSSAVRRNPHLHPRGPLRRRVHDPPRRVQRRGIPPGRPAPPRGGRRLAVSRAPPRPRGSLRYRRPRRRGVPLAPGTRNGPHPGYAGAGRLPWTYTGPSLQVAHLERILGGGPLGLTHTAPRLDLGRVPRAGKPARHDRG